MKTRMLLIAALIAAPLPAAAQTGYEVVRLGDGQKTCEVLAADIGALRSEIQALDERARRGAEGRRTAGRMGRGLLAGLAQGAAAVGFGGGMGDGVGGMIASQALSGVANQIANAPPPEEPAAAPVVEDSPQRQRLAHLTDLFGSRSC
jgi:hypothetical protein